MTLDGQDWKREKMGRNLRLVYVDCRHGHNSLMEIKYFEVKFTF